MQQRAAENPNPTFLHSLSNPTYTSRYSRYHLPNPNTNLSIGSHQPDYRTGPHVAYPHHLTALSSGYYQDPNSLASLHNWSGNAAALHYETRVPVPPPIVPVQFLPTNANPISWPNPMVRPRGNNKIRKRVLRKTKVVQSVWCEVCKVECNTREILHKHKLGKKHKKNMNESKELAATHTVPSKNLMIGPRENPSGEEKATRKADELVEDLEVKKRKVLEGGAAADAVRTCTECNVVCNSEIVFTHHIQGQKHVARMKKHTPGSEVVAKV